MSPLHDDDLCLDYTTLVNKYRGYSAMTDDPIVAAILRAIQEDDARCVPVRSFLSYRFEMTSEPVDLSYLATAPALAMRCVFREASGEEHAITIKAAVLRRHFEGDRAIDSQGPIHYVPVPDSDDPMFTVREDTMMEKQCDHRDKSVHTGRRNRRVNGLRFQVNSFRFLLCMHCLRKCAVEGVPLSGEIAKQG